MPPVVPFSLWLPLQGVVPGRDSGLGFVTDAPDRLLPVPPGSDLDLGDRVVLDNLAAVWVPTYQPGDLTIHGRYTPHFTTGYGTGSHRYSLEIRAMARDAAPHDLQDPTVYVGRRDGRARGGGLALLGGRACAWVRRRRRQTLRPGSRGPLAEGTGAGLLHPKQGRAVLLQG